jgi:hypothetical protein
MKMKPGEKEKERIAQLEKELAKVIEQRDGLAKRVQELEAVKPASKSRQQAEAVKQLLAEGPVTQAQLKELNPKYPSDGVYYVRTLLKINVHTVRVGADKGGTVYMNDAVFKTYQDGLAEEKKKAEALKAEVKAESAPKSAEASVEAAVVAGAGIVNQPAA